jgi:hypothetical protein
MNLYSIYDTESDLCLGHCKTSKQVSELFGKSTNYIAQAARRNNVINGKYLIVMEENNKPKRKPRTSMQRAGVEEKQKMKELMAEWDRVTGAIRAK